MRDADQQIIHLSHPRPVPWSRIAEFLSRTFNIPLTSYRDWLTRLDVSAGKMSVSAGKSEVDSNPALRLLHYFRVLESEAKPNISKEALGLPRLDISEGTKVSAALRDAETLTNMDVAHWVNGWEKAGFLTLEG
jgi:hypothetical protein